MFCFVIKNKFPLRVLRLAFPTSILRSRLTVREFSFLILHFRLQYQDYHFQCRHYLKGKSSANTWRWLYLHSRSEPQIMACDSFGKTATDELTMGKKFSAKGDASCKHESSGPSTSEKTRKKRVGTRFKVIPKALTYVRCCQSNTLSVDEPLEDENCLVDQTMNPNVMLCQNTFEDSTREDMKWSYIQHTPGNCIRLDVDIENCRCSRNSFEYDSLAIEKCCKKSLEPSQYIQFVNITSL